MTEHYEFTWVGKRASIAEANKPIRKTLRPCKEESKNWDTTENLYIEGDNLDVLKLLQESYLGKVKMIYIDPPYNTGNDFIYKDDFSQTVEEYEQAKGTFDDEGNRLFKNSDTNGRFHSDWCSMIYPRLMLARNLLSDDGVIFISIDDNEQENLKKICDEVFGENNFLGNIIHKTATDNNPGQIKVEHEYMLFYCKDRIQQSNWVAKNINAEKIQEKYLELKSKYNDDIQSIQNDLRKWIKKNKNELAQVSHYDNVDEKGVFHDADIQNTKMGGYDYEIIHPVTKKPVKKPQKGYRYSYDTIKIMIENNDILFGKDETVLIKPKKRLENAKSLLRSVIYEDGRSSSNKVDELIGRNVFSNPKSDNILKYIFNFITNESSIIMDFFSGSATTAHAVMQLNAEDGGKRKFIMVQLPEKTDEKSEAFKAGYENICEIGKERIRRAGEKIKAEAGLNGENLDIGFRVFKLDSTNMNDVYYSADEYDQQMLLENLESNIKADRTDMDLLFGCLLDWGLPLSLPYVSEQIDGFTVHTYNEGDLIACFAENVSEKVIEEIARRRPLRAVFRDSSFADSPAKINVWERFKLLAPDTQVKVI